MSIDTLYGYFLHNLRAAYFIENHLVDGLREMMEEATDEDLIEVLREHNGETEEQSDRLEEVFQLLNEDIEGHDFAPMMAIIDESDHLMEDIEDDDLRNLAIVNAGIMIERMEISIYESLKMLSRKLDMEEEVRDHFEDNLEEEKYALRDLKALKKESTLSRLIEKLTS